MQQRGCNWGVPWSRHGLEQVTPCVEYTVRIYYSLDREVQRLGYTAKQIYCSCCYCCSAVAAVVVAVAATALFLLLHQLRLVHLLPLPRPGHTLN